jgi:hypothetical protein
MSSFQFLQSVLAGFSGLLFIMSSSSVIILILERKKTVCLLFEVAECLSITLSLRSSCLSLENKIRFLRSLRGGLQRGGLLEVRGFEGGRS